MDGPGSALIGVGAIGVGSLLLYGAYKNVPIFGPSGVFTQAVKTGKIVSVNAPGSAATGNSGGAGGASGLVGLVQATAGKPPPNAGFYERLYSWVEHNLIGKGIT